MRCASKKEQGISRKMKFTLFSRTENHLLTLQITYEELQNTVHGKRGTDDENFECRNLNTCMK